MEAHAICPFLPLCPVGGLGKVAAQHSQLWVVYVDCHSQADLLFFIYRPGQSQPEGTAVWGHRPRRLPPFSKETLRCFP